MDIEKLQPYFDVKTYRSITKEYNVSCRNRDGSAESR
jgi:hypothetical protein